MCNQKFIKYRSHNSVDSVSNVHYLCKPLKDALRLHCFTFYYSEQTVLCLNIDVISDITTRLLPFFYILAVASYALGPAYTGLIWKTLCLGVLLRSLRGEHWNAEWLILFNMAAKCVYCITHCVCLHISLASSYIQFWPQPPTSHLQCPLHMQTSHRRSAVSFLTTGQHDCYCSGWTCPAPSSAVWHLSYIQDWHNVVKVCSMDELQTAFKSSLCNWFPAKLCL